MVTCASHILRSCSLVSNSVARQYAPPRTSLASSGLIEIEFIKQRVCSYQTSGDASKRMRQSRSLRHRTSSLFPLYIESLHFDLIYPSTYIISLSPTWVFKLGSSLQATMPLQHCLKQIQFSKTEASYQVVRTANMRYKYSASKYHVSPRA
jgi:hypothetical protein